MKICTKCQLSLPLDAFPKQHTGREGRRANCRKCHKLSTYSIKAVVTAIYGSQCKKSKIRNHPLPSYTRDELEVWLLNQPNFSSLYNIWKDSGYLTDLKPSCDRKDDYKPYTFDNLQLTTVSKNVTRYYTDAQRGINTKTATKVDQYALEGNFIKTHHSYSAAARAVNGLVSNIRNVAEGVPITRKEGNKTRSWIPTKAYGFSWKKH